VVNAALREFVLSEDGIAVHRPVIRDFSTDCFERYPAPTSVT